MTDPIYACQTKVICKLVQAVGVSSCTVDVSSGAIGVGSGDVGTICDGSDANAIKKTVVLASSDVTLLLSSINRTGSNQNFHTILHCRLACHIKQAQKLTNPMYACQAIQGQKI